jgi:hypothetical protein
MPKLPNKNEIPQSLYDIQKEFQQAEKTEDGEKKREKMGKILERIEFPHGGSNVVVEREGKDEVIAVEVLREDLRKNPLRAMQVYYLHKLLNILFPENFPKIYTLSSNKSPLRAGTIREKINFVQRRTEREDLPRKEFQKIVDICSQWNLPVTFDPSSSNYRRKKGSRKVIYTDLVMPQIFVYKNSIKVNSVIEYARRKGLNIEQIIKLLDRFKIYQAADKLNSIIKRPEEAKLIQRFFNNLSYPKEEYENYELNEILRIFRSINEVEPDKRREEIIMFLEKMIKENLELK